MLQILFLFFHIRKLGNSSNNILTYVFLLNATLGIGDTVTTQGMVYQLRLTSCEQLLLCSLRSAEHIYGPLREWLNWLTKLSVPRRNMNASFDQKNPQFYADSVLFCGRNHMCEHDTPIRLFVYEWIRSNHLCLISTSTSSCLSWVYSYSCRQW